MTHTRGLDSRAQTTLSLRPITGIAGYLRLLGGGPLRVHILIKFVASLGLCSWGLATLFRAESTREQVIGSTLAILGMVVACAIHVIYIMLAIHNQVARQSSPAAD